MRYIGAIISLCVILHIQKAFSQELPSSISFFGTFTTSAKLFHHPNDIDAAYRSQYLPIDNIFGFGIDYRRNVNSSRFKIGLNIEYLRKIKRLSYLTNQKKQIPITDGFSAIPVELTGLFRIPIGGTIIHPFMGGGIGFYWGERIYQQANIKARTINQKIGLGIHVISGIEYLLTPIISLRAEVKFRDVQFGTTNKFEQATTIYDGIIVPLPDEPIGSYMHIDGMILMLGTTLNF